MNELLMQWGFEEKPKHPYVIERWSLSPRGHGRSKSLPLLLVFAPFMPRSGTYSKRTTTA